MPKTRAVDVSDFLRAALDKGHSVLTLYVKYACVCKLLKFAQHFLNMLSSESSDHKAN